MDKIGKELFEKNAGILNLFDKCCATINIDHSPKTDIY